MPEHCYFKAKGKTQGEMAGSCTEKGFEKMTLCYHIDFSGMSPYDQATGEAAGKRAWKPIRIISKLEASCVNWLQAMTTNEEITEALIMFPAKDVSQGKMSYLTIKVTSGRFVSCRIRCPDTADPNNSHRGHECEAELVARKWEMTHFKYKEPGGVEHRGNVSTTDQWNEKL